MLDLFVELKGGYMRTLYYIPALHTVGESEDGSGPKPGTKRALAIEAVDRAIRTRWRNILRCIDALIADGTIDPTRLHLFSDGTPRLGRRRYSVRSMDPASPTYHFLREMVKRGAENHGTEDPFLLMGHILLLDNKIPLSKAQRRRMGWKFLDRRDRFIADVIARDVPDGHSALCIMGAIHRVDLLVKGDDPSWRIVRFRNFMRYLRPHDRDRIVRSRQRR